MSAPPPPHAPPSPPPPPLHHVTVARLLDAASAETPSRKAFFSVQITTKSNAKNYVAKCRNSHSGGGSNSGSSSRNGASTKEKNKNANDADPAPNVIAYESIFRVKRRFPDDFVSFRKQLRAAFPGCVVPKIFRRRRRRRRRRTTSSASASASAPPWNTDDDDDDGDDENNDSTNDNERYTFGNDDKDAAANDGSRATWSFARTVTTSGGRCGNWRETEPREGIVARARRPPTER